MVATSQSLHAWMTLVDRHLFVWRGVGPKRVQGHRPSSSLFTFTLGFRRKQLYE